MRSFMSEKIAIGFLGILYLVGFVGIGLEQMPQLVWLTPINLLLSLIIALLFDQEHLKSVLQFCMIVFLLGFGIEVLGVQTGKIFGVYQYGDILGPKILDTPLMIGVNWVLVSYSCGYTVNAVLPKLSAFAKAAIGAFLLVLLDIIIEPVAVAWGMWTWAEVDIPLQNYLAWWIIGFVMMYIFFKTFSNRTNNVGIAVFILQIIFFGLLNL